MIGGVQHLKGEVLALVNRRQGVPRTTRTLQHETIQLKRIRFDAFITNTNICGETTLVANIVRGFLSRENLDDDESLAVLLMNRQVRLRNRIHLRLDGLADVLRIFLGVLKTNQLTAVAHAIQELATLRDGKSAHAL